MKNAFKSAALYVSAVVGAGFATGREIVLYFDGLNVLSLVVSGIFMGGFCAFFMFMGSLAGEKSFGQLLLKKKGFIYDILSGIVAFVTYIVMFSAAQTLMFQKFGFEYAGVCFGAAAAVVSAFGIGRTKMISSITMPLVTVLTAVIFLFQKHGHMGGTFGLLNPVAYASMNVMFAGSVAAKAGRTSTKKQIAQAGVISAVFLTLLLFMINSSVSGRTDALPLYSAAESKGLGLIAAMVISVALLVSMILSAGIIADYTSGFFGNRLMASASVLAVAWPICLLTSFSELVDTVYPYISGAGVALTICALVRLIIMVKTDKLAFSSDKPAIMSKRE